VFTKPEKLNGQNPDAHKLPYSEYHTSLLSPKRQASIPLLAVTSLPQPLEPVDWHTSANPGPTTQVYHAL
jgi:hypothetical protein